MFLVRLLWCCFCHVPIPHVFGAAESRKKEAEGLENPVESVENADEQRRVGLARLQQRKDDVVRDEKKYNDSVQQCCAFAMCFFVLLCCARHGRIDSIVFILRIHITRRMQMSLKRRRKYVCRMTLYVQLQPWRGRKLFAWHGGCIL